MRSVFFIVTVFCLLGMNTVSAGSNCPMYRGNMTACNDRPAHECVYDRNTRACNFQVCDKLVNYGTCSYAPDCHWIQVPGTNGKCQTRPPTMTHSISLAMDPAPAPPTTSCSSQSTQSRCTALTQCAWSNSKCVLNCNKIRVYTNCTAASHCKWMATSTGEYCTFRPTNPGTNTTNGTNTSTSTPVPMPTTGCSGYSTATRCSAISSCSWYNQRCVINCTVIRNPNNCSHAQHCKWMMTSNAEYCGFAPSSGTNSSTPAPPSMPVLNCSKYSDSKSCTDVFNCSWLTAGVCILKCSILDSRACVAAKHCEWKQASGKAYCAHRQHTPPTPPQQQHTMTMTMEDPSTPTSCADITTATRCGASMRCSWMHQKCVLNCSTITTYASCKYAHHCTWSTTSGTNGRCTFAQPSTPAPTNPSGTPAPAVNCPYYYSKHRECPRDSGCVWSKLLSSCVQNCMTLSYRNCTASTYCQYVSGSTPGTMGNCTFKTGCSIFQDADRCGMQDQCEWKENRCSTKPPPPAPTQCGDMNAAQCKEATDCTLTNFTMSTGSEVQKCVLKPCLQFHPSQCPTARCWADSQAKRCLPMPCNRYPDYKTCGTNSAGACYWYVDQANNRSGCFPRDCSTITYNRRACENSPRCQWSQYADKCYDLHCSSGSCFKHFCQLGAAVKNGKTYTTCAPRTCSNYNIDSCPPRVCVVADGACKNAPCRYVSDATKCWGRSDCMWTQTQTTAADGTSPASSTTTGTGGYCTDKPCTYQRDATSCWMNKCRWDNRTGTCHYSNCYTLGYLKTSAQDCNRYPTCSAWTAAPDTRLSCLPRKCEYRTSVQACTRPCFWDRTANKCRTKPCVNYTTEDSCPTGDGSCAWNKQIQMCQKGLCGGGYVNGKLNATRCNLLPGCTGIMEMCIDSNVQYSVPCRVADSKTKCEQFPKPQGRCSWTQLNETAGFCKPASSATEPVVPCYKVPTGAKCPSHCSTYYGICINPLCHKIFKNITCRSENCRWTGAKCEDPRAAYFPCKAFPTQSSCPRRCTWNVSSCIDYQRPEPTPTPTTCEEITDIPLCTKVDACWFNETSAQCEKKPCSQYRDADSCPATRCRFYNDKCSKPCPTSRPYFCPNIGTCARSKESCMACPSSVAQCWDGSCAASSNECPCPPERSIRCNNGRCVENSTRCELACPAGAVRCWNNECARSWTECPCPTTKPNKCNVSGKVFCVVSKDECVRGCPTAAPFKCWNGQCARNSLSCPCHSTRPYRCNTDQKCYATKQACPCRNATIGGAAVAYVRCDDNTCRRSKSECGMTKAPATPRPTVQCPAAKPYECPDGSCAPYRYLCSSKCEGYEDVVPTITILSTSNEFDVTSWLRLKANVSFVVCGINRAFTLPVVWTAFDTTTSADVVDAAGKPVTTRGASIAVRTSTYFVPGRAYTFMASVQSPYSQFTATASVDMTATAPAPELSMLGGDRVMREGPLRLAVQIVDKLATAADKKSLFWLCSMNNGLNDCPTVVNTAIANLETAYGYIQRVPAGNYTFTAFYKGLNVSADITVVATAVPTVQIVSLLRNVYEGQSVRLYAIVRHNSRTKLQWYVNGKPISGLTSQSVTIPAMYFRALIGAKVSVVATDVNTMRQGRSSIYVRPLRRVDGSCKVTITAGAVAGKIVALKTQVKVQANFNSTETLQYRFGYVDRDSNNKDVEYKLTPFWQELSFYQFRVPILWFNEVKDTYVVAAARRVGGRNIVSVRCPIRIEPASATELTDAAQTKAAEVEAAANSNDTATALETANTAASTLRSVANSTLRRKAAESLIGGVTTAARKAASTMSSTERGTAVRTVQRVLAANDVNKTEAREFVRKNAAKILSLLRDVLDAKDESGIDTETDGNATLEVLGKNRIAENRTHNIEIAKAVAKLARRTARAAALGVASNLRSGNISVSGIARSALDLGARRFGGSKGGCKLPVNFTIPGKNETTVVQMSSVEYDENPVGETGKPENTTLIGNVAEFNIDVDGEEHEVKNQDPPLEISFKVPESVNTTGKKWYCRYFNLVSQRWTSEGVNFVRYNSTTREIFCNTTHLSIFGAMGDNDPEANNNNGNSGSTGSTPTPATSGSTPTPGGSNPATPTPGGSTPATPAPGGSTGATPTPGGTAGTPAPQTSGATPAPVNNNNNNNNGGGAATDSSDGAITGAAVGGAIGGVVVIAVIALIIIKRKGDDGTGQSDEEYGVPLNELTVPQPHHESELRRPHNVL